MSEESAFKKFIAVFIYLLGFKRKDFFRDDNKKGFFMMSRMEWIIA